MKGAPLATVSVGVPGGCVVPPPLPSRAQQDRGFADPLSSLLDRPSEHTVTSVAQLEVARTAPPTPVDSKEKTLNDLLADFLAKTSSEVCSH
jgi:hypothetical protein